MRDIGARVHVDPKLVRTGRLLVVLGQPLSYLACGAANYVVDVGVVIRGTAEYLDPDGPLFERVTPPLQSPFNDMLQEARIAFTVPERGAEKNSIELLPNRLLAWLSIGQRGAIPRNGGFRND